MKNKGPIKWRGIMLLAAGMTAALMTGCGTTPSGIRVGPYAKYGATMLSPTEKRPHPHTGVDFLKPKGSPIFAAANGVVTKATHFTKANRKLACDQTIEIKHNGLAKDFETQYCHLGQVLVNFGDTVKRGQVIASIGKCGRGPPHCAYHLHFGITENFIRHDPMTKIAGCRRDETIELTRERPLIYPVKC